MDVAGDLTLQWVEEVGNVIHEEVICDLETDLVAPEPAEIGACQEVAVEETIESVPEATSNNDTEILMVSQSNEMEPIYIVPQDQGHDYLNIQVTEEVITDNWDRSGPDDGVEIPETKVSHDLLEYDDMEIPLPIDQDSYTNSRPYPCDFCSRRFRKKANLMNHMVAHQTDRPHGCNLCGARYVRKCDLMNHLKIHAYAPSRDDLEDDLNDEDSLVPDEEEEETTRGRRKKVQSSAPRKRKNNASANSTAFNAAANAAAVSAATANAAATAAAIAKRVATGDEDKMDISNNFASSSRWEDHMAASEISDSQTTPMASAAAAASVTATRWPITDPTKPYVCQFCGVGFAREKALASHSRIHGGDSPFECTQCSEMFWDVNTLREHMRSKHGGETIGQSDTEETENNESNYTGDERFGEFFCSTCGVPFHRLDLLKRHQKIHIKEEMDITEGPSTHHVCNVCGEWFEEALALLAHAELHARSPTRRCLLCGERCRDDAEVAEHVRQNHADDAPPNTCTLCGKTCKDKRSLLKHAWVHSVDKTFGCTKCGKRFHSKARLRRHMVSHRNKMVACDECGEEFPDGRALVSHRHSHNKELGGRTFPCRECGKTFGSRSSQQIHIRIHTGERPYGCRFCWKAFADGGTLRKHERIHTGEKPYGCAICPRAFNQRVVLREHVRAHHSGPDPKCHGSLTPYLCKVCGDAYPTSEDIVAHIVQHCDDNTALRRQPQAGPRKYKRRRNNKLPAGKPTSSSASATSHQQQQQQQHQQQTDSSVVSRINESYDALEETTTTLASDSDDNVKRKLGRKNKQQHQQHRSNVEEGYQNVLKSFESSLQNINSLVSNAKSSPGKGSKASKKKLRNKEDKSHGKDSQSTTNAAGAAAAAAAAAAATNQQQSGRPKMIHTQKTRVPVEVGSDGVKKGQKTKTMVTRTPKLIASEGGQHAKAPKANQQHQQQQQQQQQQQLQLQQQSNHETRNRPRTKNVSYHVEGKLQLPLATFPKSSKEAATIGNSSTTPETTANSNSSFKVAGGGMKLETQATGPRRSLNENGGHSHAGTNVENEKPSSKRKSSASGSSTPRKAARKQKQQQIIKEEPKDHEVAEQQQQQQIPNINNNNNNNSNNNNNNNGSSSNVIPEETLPGVQENSRLLVENTVDGANMEVAFEASIVTSHEDEEEESILPDKEPMEEQCHFNHAARKSNAEKEGNVKLSVKVDSNMPTPHMLAVHSVIASVESVPETIIPDVVEYTCEMCSAVFSSRAELLVHVPIHI